MYPAQLNYKMPPEWGKHDRTLISWPVQDSMCYPSDYEPVCCGYAEIIRAIAEFEPVTVLVNPGEGVEFEKLSAAYPVTAMILAHNDSWLRDNGPTFVTDAQGSVAAVNWEFNAWGEKYIPYDLDDQLAAAIAEKLGVKRFDAPLIMEGGSFHADGEGTLLTTEECLLNKNRNPGLDKMEIEDYLQKYLGIEKVVWLKRGLAGDETDGHVDNIACFGGPGKILLQVCDDEADENYSITQENISILSRMTDAGGRKLEIIPIKQPPARYHQNQRLTLSYLNFYLVNGGIILPVFGGDAVSADEAAVRTLSQVFPGRRVRRVDGMSIIREGGNVHCATQQVPEGC